MKSSMTVQEKGGLLIQVTA